jgi:hypothetical protein
VADPRVDPYDRETLCDEVWREPRRDVARRYGVSDVYLARNLSQAVGAAPVPRLLGEARGAPPQCLAQVDGLARMRRVVGERQAGDELDEVRVSVAALSEGPRGLENVKPLERLAMCGGVGRAVNARPTSRTFDRAIDLKIGGG